MKRRLLNVVTVLSLLLFVTTSGLWLRSHFVGDRIVWRTDRRDDARATVEHVIWSFSTGGGKFEVARQEMSYSTRARGFSGGPGFIWERTDPIPPSLSSYVNGPRLKVIGWGVHKGDTGDIVFAFFRLVGTLWALAVVAALVPLGRTPAMMRWWQQHRRRRTGLCPHCNYDLRATPGRCPECGTSVSVAPRT